MWNSSDEVAALFGQELAQGLAPSFFVLRHDHLAHGKNAARVKEHMFGAAKANAFRAELPRGLASSGVSALARTPRRRTLSAQSISLAKSPVSSGWIVSTAPFMISTRCAVDGDDVACLDRSARAR